MRPVHYVMPLTCAELASCSCQPPSRQLAATAAGDRLPTATALAGLVPAALRSCFQAVAASCLGLAGVHNPEQLRAYCCCSLFELPDFFSLQQLLSASCCCCSSV